jgi:hypothetical protein
VYFNFLGNLALGSKPPSRGQLRAISSAQNAPETGARSAHRYVSQKSETHPSANADQAKTRQ